MRSSGRHYKGECRKTKSRHREYPAGRELREYTLRYGPPESMWAWKATHCPGSSGPLFTTPRWMDARRRATIPVFPLSSGIALSVPVERVYGFEAARAQALALRDGTVHVRLRIQPRFRRGSRFVSAGDASTDSTSRAQHLVCCHCLVAALIIAPGASGSIGLSQ